MNSSNHFGLKNHFCFPTSFNRNCFNFGWCGFSGKSVFKEFTLPEEGSILAIVLPLLFVLLHAWPLLLFLIVSDGLGFSFLLTCIDFLSKKLAIGRLSFYICVYVCVYICVCIYIDFNMHLRKLVSDFHITSNLFLNV